MPKAKIISQLLPLLFFAGNLAAQPDGQPNPPTSPVAPINQNLKLLKPAEKLEFLEYLRHLGGEIDEEIIWLFGQLPPENQEKAERYLRSKLGDEDGKPPKTFVEYAPSDTLDLGELEEGEIKIDSFFLKNVGDQPYQISKIVGTCDCTVLKHPVHPIMPGETAIIRVEFNSKDKKGRFDSGIIIYDNSKPNLRNILYLKSIIRKKKVFRG